MKQENQIPKTDVSDKDRYHTLPQAAQALGIPRPFSSRKRVLLSEVVAAIAAHKAGGQDNG